MTYNIITLSVLFLFNVQVYAACISVSDADTNSPKHSAIEWLQLGVKAFVDGDFTVAEGYFKRAIRKDPNLTEAYVYLGQAFTDQEKYYEAICVYMRALAVDDKFTGAYLGMAHTKLKLGDKVGALHDADKALELNEELAEAYRIKGIVLSKAEEYQAAYEAFRQGAVRLPSNGHLVYLMGEMQLEMGEFFLAAELFRKSIRLGFTKPAVWRTLGYIESFKGNYQEAISVYNQGIKRYPKQASLYQLRGKLFFEQGELEAAKKDYSKAIHLDKMLPDNYFMRGKVYAQQKKNKQALSDLNKAIELSPNASSIFFDLRANIRVQLGHYPQAIDDFNKSIAIWPGEGSTYLKRAKLLLRKQDITKACLDLSIAHDFGLTEADELMQKYCKSSGQ